MTDDNRPNFDGWAILELMGHRRLGGYVREEQIAGAAFIRIDVPEHPTAVCTCGSTDPDSLSHEDHNSRCMLFAADNAAPADVVATQFYAPAAIYCITPATEHMARLAAQTAKVEPVQEWEARWLRPELPAAIAAQSDEGHGSF